MNSRTAATEGEDSQRRKRISVGRLLLAWLPVLLVLGVIALASGDIASESNVEQAVSGRVPTTEVGPEGDEVDLLHWVLWGLRKPAHLLLYGALGLFLLRALLVTLPGDIRPPLLAVAVVAASALVATLDELNQSFQPDRTGLWTDVVLDSGGAGLGVWLALTTPVRRRVRR